MTDTTMKQLRLNITDGGRSKYFKASQVGDCVTRAIALATGKDYKEVYNKITKIVGYTPRNGVKKKDTKKAMQYFGGEWHATMSIGTGCQVHLAENEIPMQGNIVCQLSGHVCNVKNGVINDSFDPSREGTRCVYGYWRF